MQNKRIKVGIIGLGMVGEPIRRWFEELNGYKRGQDLFCYDVDRKKGYNDDVNKAEVIFVSVPSPSNPDGSCNTSIVEAGVAKIRNGKIVVVKSTIPPGTVEHLQKKYPQKRLIFNPEFLTESQAWHDFVSPDRQIVAHTAKSISDTVEVLNLLPKRHFIRPWTSDYSKKSINATEAEFGKYASNVFGYMKVIYGNILADMCYAINKVKGLEMNYDNVRDILSADLRIGPSWLNVSHGNYCGSGGYCFPKDMNAFIAFGEALERDAIQKKLLDKNHLKVLQMGLAVLKAIKDYNKALIESQGLTIEDVAKHDKEILVKKRKKIRE